MNKFKYIVDMDGTLYKFDKGKTRNFIDSMFYEDLRINIISFLIKTFMLDESKALLELVRIDKKYKGEISIGIEKEYGLDRIKYYELTWSSLNPNKYIDYDPNLEKVLNKARGDLILLTSAPRIWTDKVLSFLKLKDLFGEFIFTGEPDLRKPNPDVFRNIARKINLPTSNFFSIGDQEITDIIPAKRIGMKTVLIGSSQDTVADYQVSDIKSAVYLLKKEGFI